MGGVGRGWVDRRGEGRGGAGRGGAERGREWEGAVGAFAFVCSGDAVNVTFGTKEEAAVQYR